MTKVTFVKILTAAALLASGSISRAATLYTTNASGVENLFVVDIATGATSPAPQVTELGFDTFNGLSSVPGDSSVLYALNNPRPAVFEDPQTSRLARIDLATGEVTLFPLFDESTLGFAEPFSHAIAISQKDKSKAIVAGVATRERRERYLWEIDLTDGSVIGPAIRIPDERGLRSLTYGLEGETLYGMDFEGNLVTADHVTGTLSTVGDPGLSDFVEGLAFHPFSGELYAVNGQFSDALLILDPNDGSVLQQVGPLGIPGPEGLAFVPIPGDANGDAKVDLMDFAILKSNFNSGESLTEGDFNLDGAVDLADFSILKDNFSGSAAQSVPEPASLLLSVLALVFIFLKRPLAA